MAAEKHGTRAEYLAGCRCAPCKAAWATYMQDYRARKRAGQPPDQTAAIARELARADVHLQRDEDAEVPVRLTPLEYRILTELQRKARLRRGEVLGRLLRECGPSHLASA